MYTVYLTRTDNGDTISVKDFTDQDLATEYAETWANDAVAYQIIESNGGTGK